MSGKFPLAFGGFLMSAEVAHVDPCRPRAAQPDTTCLTDAEWKLARPFLPPEAACNRRRRWLMRILLDGMLYVLETGCAWRHGSTSVWILVQTRSRHAKQSQ